MKIEMVILTKSEKNSGYCVAGVDLKTGEWIRLETNDVESNGALSEKNLKYQNGEYCKVLDCVEVDVVRHMYSEIQPENVLMNTRIPLKKIDRYSLNQVIELHPLELHEQILGNVWPYIRHDRVNNADGSLVFIKATNLRLHNEQNSKGQLKRKIDFVHNNQSYSSFSITDSDFNRVINEEERYREGYLVISLPEISYNERHYKCVSKIFV